MAKVSPAAARPRRVRKAAAPTTADPVEIAMEAEASGKAPEGVAARLLTKQEKLVGWQIASERSAVALKLLTAAAGVVVAGVLAAMAWQASRANGIVVKPFSVPPALATRGVTGEAVARRVMDDLARIAQTTRSNIRERQVATDEEQAPTLEIPSTGVSLAQVDQWLRAKLGHEQSLSGELSQEPDGRLTLRTRLGGQPLPDQTASEADLDAMVLRTAEAIYSQGSERSWMLYLVREGRWVELLDLGRQQAASGTPEQRAGGYTNMGRALAALEGQRAAAGAYRRALRLANDPAAASNLSDIEFGWGHDEAAYQLRNQALAQVLSGKREGKILKAMTEEGRRGAEAYFRSGLAAMIGDYNAELEADLVVRDTSNVGGFGSAGRGVAASAMSRARLHDIYGAMEDVNDSEPSALVRAQSNFAINAHAGDWAGALTALDALDAEMAKAPDAGEVRIRAGANRARALIGVGRLDEAEALIEKLPLDCSPCTEARGVAAAARGDRQTADHWFAETVRITPSLPQPNNTWGRALLARGDAKAALAKFDAAHARSPRYPDAIEGRGEALLGLGDAKGASAAFEEAAELAPKWGRLHAQWGAALARLGKRSEAEAQFKLASTLYLTSAERAELQRLSGR